MSIELGLAGEFPDWWDYAFDFGFSFPFYDETFEQVNLSYDGYGYFRDSDEYNLLLFSGDFVISTIIDTTNMTSEIRYHTLLVDGVNALVIESYNVYEMNELEEFGMNHYLNFQYWFYENGIIEIRFGDIDLTRKIHQKSYYDPKSLCHSRKLTLFHSP